MLTKAFIYKKDGKYFNGVSCDTIMTTFNKNSAQTFNSFPEFQMFIENQSYDIKQKFFNEIWTEEAIVWGS